MDQDGLLKDTIRYDLKGNYSTDIYTDRAVELIRGSRQQGSHNTSTRGTPQQHPWFIYLAYTAPHLKYQAPKDKQHQYAQHMVISSKRRRLYASMISVLDEGVGRVVDVLDEVGVRENTVIVFASDNGAPIGEGAGSNYPFKGGKKSFYEGGVRSVSFVNSPLLHKTGYVNRNIHHVVDWFPTFEYLASGGMDHEPTESLIG